MQPCFAIALALFCAIATGSQASGNNPPVVKEAKRSNAPMVERPVVVIGHFENPFANTLVEGLVIAIRKGDAPKVQVHVGILKAMNLPPMSDAVSRVILEAMIESKDVYIKDLMIRFFFHESCKFNSSPPVSSE